MIADRRARHAAEQAVRLGDDARHSIAELVGQQIDRAQRHGLQIDPAAPFFAHVAQHLPASLGSLLIGVDMGADRRHAVRIGAAQAELHAAAQIRRGPVRPVGGGCKTRIEKGAVAGLDCARRCGPCRDGCECRSRSARPDGRRDRHARHRRSRASVRRFDARKLAAIDQKISLDHAFGIDAGGERRGVRQQANRHPGVSKPETLRLRPSDLGKFDRHCHFTSMVTGSTSMRPCRDRAHRGSAPRRDKRHRRAWRRSTSPSRRH